MEIIRVYDIKERAQDFMKAPELKKLNKDELLVFDYETETGEYKLTGIVFKDVVISRYTKEAEVERYMIDAYNSVSIVKKSPWIKNIDKSVVDGTFEHYLIYFDGYGAYEFIARRFIAEINYNDFSAE